MRAKQKGAWTVNRRYSRGTCAGLAGSARALRHALGLLTGFLDAGGHALGRPAGIAIDRASAVLVADDVGNTIWRVTPAAAVSATAAPKSLSPPFGRIG